MKDHTLLCPEAVRFSGAYNNLYNQPSPFRAKERGFKDIRVTFLDIVKTTRIDSLALFT